MTGPRQPSGLPRRLDDRFVPGAAGWLRDAVTTARSWLDRIPWPQPAPELPDEPEPEPPLPWRQRAQALDDRYARSGLLGFIAEVPQLAVVLVTLLLAISAFTVADRQANQKQATSTTGQGTGPEAGADPTLALVGILPGTSVNDYISQSTRELDQLAVRPDASVLALMMFDHYVTPAEAAQLADPAQPTRAYYAPKAKGIPPGETAFASVVNIAVDLPAQMHAAAGQLLVRVKQNESFAAAIPGNTAEERAQKAEQLRDAATWRREAQSLQGTCACVFAVVIRAPARVLVGLARRAGVRVIDAAPAGAQASLVEFHPLRPETTGVEPSAPPAAP